MTPGQKVEISIAMDILDAACSLWDAVARLNTLNIAEGAEVASAAGMAVNDAIKDARKHLLIAVNSEM